MKAMILLILLSSLAVATGPNGEPCRDFSDRLMHDYTIEYGEYRPSCPECEDPKYSEPKPWYKIVEKEGFPKKFGDMVDNPFGYEKEYPEYSPIYKQKLASIQPEGDAVVYSGYMGSVPMKPPNAAANLAIQEQFKQSFVPWDACNPDAELTPEYIDISGQDEDSEPIMDEDSPEPPESIEDEKIEGCMDSSAKNYNPKANVDMPCEYDDECDSTTRFNYETKKCENPCLEWQKLVKEKGDKVGHCIERCPATDLEHARQWDPEKKNIC